MVSIRRAMDGLAVPLAVGIVAVGAARNWQAWRRGLEAIDDHSAAWSNDDPTTGHEPRISVLAAGWNEAGAIERHIRSFLELSYRPLELIVCAGGEDGTYDIARNLRGERVIVLEQYPGEGKQGALQRCLDASGGEIIMLTDADCEFSEMDFRRLIHPLVRGTADVVTGNAQPWFEQRRLPFVQYQWLLDLARPEPADRRAGGVLGRNCALRRHILEDLAVFGTPAPTGTDYVLSMLLRRAGYEIDLVPDSRIPTQYPESASAYLAMWRRWIKNILVHAPSFGAHDEIGRTLPAVGIAGLTLLVPLTTPVTGRMAVAGPLAVLGVATLNRLRRVSLGARRAETAPSLAVLGHAPFMAVLDACAVLLAVVDVASPGGRKRW